MEKVARAMGRKLVVKLVSAGLKIFLRRELNSEETSRISFAGAAVMGRNRSSRKMRSHSSADDRTALPYRFHPLKTAKNLPPSRSLMI